MATARVTVNVTSPYTQLTTYADLVSQDQAGNFSTVYYWVQAINTGDTTSHYNSSGSQLATVGGQGNTGHTGSLPSYVGHNVQRWYDGPWGVNLGHDSDGNRGADAVTQSITWGWNRSDSGSIGPYPRIAKMPATPGMPVASAILPTSLTLSWTASANDNGSGIDFYLLRRWDGPTATGPYVDTVVNGLSNSPSGLTAGSVYTWGVYAHNGSAQNGGYSALSTVNTVTQLAPMHVKINGVWKFAVPYVKINGVWKMAQPFVRINNVWKATG